MRGKEIFGSKKSFELEKATKLNEAEGKLIILEDFEVYDSRKYGSKIGVVQDKEGNLYYTWSAVICDKLTQLKELEANEWHGLELVPTVKHSQESGREYYDLILAE